jgi:dTDP-glucose pyrophosphorylase
MSNKNIQNHLISHKSLIKDALFQLNQLGKDAILFVTNHHGILLGSITDGDIRRGLIKGITVEQCLLEIIQPNPKFIKKGDWDFNKIITYRESNFRIIPILDNNGKVVKIINFRNHRSYLPVDVVIMAGGLGQRLLPLTKNTPKPLLKVGSKPILEHNIDRMISYGIYNFSISINYLGNQIVDYFKDGNNKNININYIKENRPLGTIGSISKLKKFEHDYVLISNSDILTNLDYEHFFVEFMKNAADIGIVTIPYKINIPYAVLETNNNNVISLKEKPTYTYYANGGIYLVKKQYLNLIPPNTSFNATDLIEKMISLKKKIFSYSLAGYWLDIGTPSDFEKAQEDITSIKF